MKCRICDHEISPFMSYGKMPISNGFLLPEQFKEEYFFELKPAFCDKCLTFQIEEQPDPEMMFHDHYAFFSRTSQFMVRHFTAYAEWVYDKHLGGDDLFVVEIGSNDGIMLENFAKRGVLSGLGDTDIQHAGQVVRAREDLHARYFVNRQ